MLPPEKLSLRDFHYSPESRVLSAELSQFGPEQNWIRQIDENGQYGIVIVSHHTGRELICEFSAERRDAEGELLAYEFEPIDSIDTVESVILFND